MSIKTLRKRIALVAVSALGVGFLSVAPASAANFAADEADVAAQTSLVNVGACSVSTGGQGGVFVVGSLVQIDVATDDDIYISLSGAAANFEGAFVTATPTTALTVTQTATTMYNADSTDAGDSYTIRLREVGTVTVTFAETSTAAAEDAYDITVVSACAGGTFDASKSNVTIVDVLEADSDESTATQWVTDFDNVDTPDEEIVAVAGTGYVRAQLNDAYGANLPEKAMVATGSTGCNVGIAAITSSVPSITTTSQTAVLSSTGADVIVAVKAATTGAAVNCTVTISWNGITVGTESFVMQGVAASVTVSDVTVGEKGGYGYFRATVKDSLGRALPSADVSWSTLNATNAAALQVVSAVRTATTGSSTSASTGAKYGTTPAITSNTIGDSSVARYTCTSKGGPAKIVVRTLQSGVTYVSSAPVDVYCGGASVDTWTISMDKAVYAPGEIATLTVTAKDSDGHLANSLLALGTLEASFAGMTAVTAPTSVDKFDSAAGAKTYKYTVGTTEGSFVGTFKITGTTDTAAKTVQYKVVAPPTGAVSNAEVLAAIVKLIASINKQIRALQKQLRR